MQLRTPLTFLRSASAPLPGPRGMVLASRTSRMYEGLSTLVVPSVMDTRQRE
jgi:hypothetical protein